MRVLVPKKPKHRRLRGDRSLKKPKQYGGLKWETFISRRYAMFFPASWGFSGIRQGFSSDTWPTNYRHAADCWQKIFVKAVNDSRPTVGRLSANSGPTIGQQLTDYRPTVARLSADCRPTVGQQSANSFLGELFFIFSKKCERGHQRQRVNQANNHWKLCFF